MTLLLTLSGLSLASCDEPTPKPYQRVKLHDGRILNCQIDNFTNSTYLTCLGGITINRATNYEVLPVTDLALPTCTSAIDGGNK